MSWKRASALGAVLLVLGAAILIYARRPSNDFKVYVASGEAVLRGQDIYAAPLPLVNTGPPFFSMLCVGPALACRLSPTLAMGLWTLVNLLALLVILDMAARALNGRGLPITSAKIIVPVLLTLPYILYHLQYHQVNLIIFAITLGGMKLQEHQKNWQGGVLVGVGTALKIMPVLFVAYLLYRRRWQAALWAMATTILLTFSPSLILGRERFCDDLQHWVAMIPNNPCWDAGQRNQSLLAMWDRVVGHGLLPLASTGFTYLGMSGDPVVKILWLTTLLGIALLTLGALRGSPKRGSLTAVLEWSVIFVASTIVGPVGWKHYFVVLLLPNMALYEMSRSNDNVRLRRTAVFTMVACFLLSMATVRDLWGSAWCLRLGMSSNLTISMLTMIAGLLWLRRMMPKEEQTDIPAHALERPMTGAVAFAMEGANRSAGARHASSHPCLTAAELRTNEHQPHVRSNSDGVVRLPAGPGGE